LTTSGRAGIDPNELNARARGGTELMQSGLYQRLPRDLRDAFQIVSSRIGTLDPDRSKLLWLHDQAKDPEVGFLADAKMREVFAKLIFVSDWQLHDFNSFFATPFTNAVVLRNAIEPIAAHKKPGGGVRLIYHTTPHRGLNILYTVFDGLCRMHDDIELDVYSSFKLYGWDHRDAPYEPLYEACRRHPKIRYHGAVENDEIRRALTEAHIFAYPSVWRETSCISAIEALDAKCVMVCSDLGALPETTGGFAHMYPYQADVQAHANTFGQTLHKAILAVKTNTADLQDHLTRQKQYFDATYAWEKRIGEWIGLMRSLLKT
jgi:glycosyltransferase involved in cell wall biosynthesis